MSKRVKRHRVALQHVYSPLTRFTFPLDFLLFFLDLVLGQGYDVIQVRVRSRKIEVEAAAAAGEGNVEGLCHGADRRHT